MLYSVEFYVAKLAAIMTLPGTILQYKTMLLKVNLLKYVFK